MSASNAFETAIDNVVVATGQAITVTSYTLTEGNA